MFRFLAILVCLLGTAVCHAADVERLRVDGLPNLYRVSDKVFSGGLPAGDAAFARLREIGIETIISVDGAQPDVESARKHGLRYVHLPHGYDGISSTHAKALAKAITELPGPIYIHCHHGQHRSPAAAMVACIGAGQFDPQQGVEFLRLAGTSERYIGLYASVVEAQPFSAAELTSLDVAFAEIAEVPPLAKAMVEIETTIGHLDMARQSNWQPRAAHPDIVAAHEALILKEHFAEILRNDPLSARHKGFRRIVESSRQAAERIESELSREALTAEAVSRINADMSAIKRDCRRCHESYRDRPVD